MRDVIISAGQYALAMRGHVKPQVKEVSDREAHKKGEKELFSEVDLEVQRRIIEELLRKYGSDIGIIAEEEAGEFSRLRNFGKLTNGVNVFIDPIDGTKNYLEDSPLWGISLGIAERREPISGIIYLPALNIILETRVNGGTFINGERIRLETDYKEGDFVRVSGSVVDSERLRKLFPEDSTIRPRSFVGTVLGLLGRDRTKPQNYRAYIGGNIDVCDLGSAVLMYREAGGVALDISGGEINPLENVYREGKTYRTKGDFVLSPSKESALRIIEKIIACRKGEN